MYQFQSKGMYGLHQLNVKAGPGGVGRPTEMPTPPEGKLVIGEICYGHRNRADQRWVCETLEDMQVLYEKAIRQRAFDLRWWSGPYSSAEA